MSLAVSHLRARQGVAAAAHDLGHGQPPSSGDIARMDTTNLPALAPTTTVNGVLRLVPDASGLSLERGVDMCCGGSGTLAEACDDAELELDALLAELRALPREPA